MSQQGEQPRALQGISGWGHGLWAESVCPYPQPDTVTASSALHSRRIPFPRELCPAGAWHSADTDTESCFSRAFRAFSVPSFHLLFQGDPSPASQLSLLLGKLLSQMKTSQHGSSVKPRHLHMPLAPGGGIWVSWLSTGKAEAAFLFSAGQGHSRWWRDPVWAAREPFPVPVCWNVGQQPVLQH